MVMEIKRIYVICIDRDADITRKTGEKGPILGREENLRVAVKLGLADPTESDTNTIFEAVRLYDFYREQGREVRVATLVGDENVGVVSDEAIARQLDEILAEFKPDGVVLVTDGAEDEHILPIVESRAKVISVSRVIVKQSEQLESTYYLLLDFMKGIANDPKLSRIIIGLPGIALVLYMLLGPHSWRLIGGVLGVFLIIKGFDLECVIFRSFQEFKTSFIAGKLSFFTYLVAVILAILGTFIGLREVEAQGYVSLAEGVPDFIVASIDFFMFAALIALVGKSIDALLEEESISRYMILMVFVIALRLILDSVALYMRGNIANDMFALSLTLGLVLTMVAFLGIRGRGKKTAKA
jgi:putative membrane protein